MHRAAKLTWLLLLVIVFLPIRPLFAADFSRRGGTILMEGEIVAGDLTKLEALTRGHDIEILRLRSPGGDVMEAIKISEFLNSRLITADAPSGLPAMPTCHRDDFGLNTDNQDNCVCNSACAFIWLTAPQRKGDFIGVHRPRFGKQYFANLNAAQAKTKYAELLKSVTTFLADNDVPNSLISKMLAASSGDLLMLTLPEVDRIDVRRPYLEELLLAKCDEFRSDYATEQQLLRKVDAALDDHAPVAEIIQRSQALFDFQSASQYQKCAGMAVESLRAERQSSFQ